jgi:tRNA threonylcarbamoyladenosine dehydratase
VAPTDERETFYAELTARNHGLVAPEVQQALRRTRFVIAGCGSTGGAVIMPLVRTGAESLVLLDPGEYELNNLNRQDATLADVGRNKARAAQARVLAVNPNCAIEVFEEGVHTSSIGTILEPGDFVVDAVDVTDAAGINAKMALHEAALALRLTVLTAYDIAATQFIELFDYAHEHRALAGRVKAARTEPETVLRALIPPFVLPREIFPVLLERRRNPDLGFPQLAMTSTLLGALAVGIILRRLSGKPVRRRVHVDIADLLRPPARRAAGRLRTGVELVDLWARLR